MRASSIHDQNRLDKAKENDIDVNENSYNGAIDMFDPNISHQLIDGTSN